MLSLLSQNCVCLLCGTNQQNQTTGCCIHGHDDWLEEMDSIDRFSEASKRFKLSIIQIKYALRDGKALTIPVKSERVNVKISKEQKEILQIAASIKGSKSLSEFIVETMVKYSNQIIEEQEYTETVIRNKKLFVKTVTTK